ncbi:heavy metal translocating P-type ATPase [uncultured Cellulomonas sp.]|uniref:heavy metal translocating P-type ATPase n=1 Tax=uncultured Cellulomonas sp. TaxID=189682 RepID=UPI002607377A|nr:heavy metal translocating P-type ATPase [uncultured Cellulomonas sp.]
MVRTADRDVRRVVDHVDVVLFWAATAGLLGGGATRLLGQPAIAEVVWTAGAVLGLAASGGWLVGAIRRHQPTVDVIAALALGGALAIGEPLAGALITVMLASGRMLDARAQRRARRDLSALVQRIPQRARRRVGDVIDEVPVDDVAVGDRLLVARGEIVPVDGRLLVGATLDESALTGEPLPVERYAGDDVRSGVTNAGSPIDMIAGAPAAGSTYAGVVRLVQQAQASSAPLVRTADRFAVFFVPLTLALAGAAWALAGDPVRAVAVLVVATPCPLLLAAPIALVSGLSSTARHGVVVKGGAALEALARPGVVLFDKTGTLTQGRPTLTEVLAAGADPAPDELLRLAACLEQVSPHVLAGPIVSAASRRGLHLQPPADVQEVHGRGLRGRVGSRTVAVGALAWLEGAGAGGWARAVRRRAALEGASTVFVAVDDVLAGAILLSDPLRPDAPRMVRALRTAGVGRVVLVTGDRADVAQAVGRVVGVDSVHAELDPAGKVEVIRREGSRSVSVMVGDGLNDAPALAAAGIGVALGARGATASSEAADVVLTVDRVDALADAILIARRSTAIARQAVGIGMGLSVAAMAAAAAGALPPVTGAALQEMIDVVAILVALRAVRPGPLHTPAMPPADVATVHRLWLEHQSVQSLVDRLRTVADALTDEQVDLADVRLLTDRLELELVAHESADEDQLVPIAARALGGTETTAALSRTHAEIVEQVGRLRRLLDEVDRDGAAPQDVVDLRRMLYGLYAVLRLHNAQEDEQIFSLVPTLARQ